MELVLPKSLTIDLELNGLSIGLNANNLLFSKITSNLRILIGSKLCYGATGLETRDQFH